MEEVAQQAPDAPLTEHAWRRVHPLTPVMRSWRTVAALLAVITVRSESAFRSALQSLTGTGDSSEGSHSNGLHLSTMVILLILGALILALALLLLLNWISWRATSFRITDTEVEVRRGVVVKQHRNARLDRVQAIDVLQPLVPRLLGLAELSFDVAGSGSSSLRISMLKRSDAEELREAMLGRVRYLQNGSESVSPQEPGGASDVAPTASRGSGETAVSPASVGQQHRRSATRRSRTLGAQLVETLSREGTAVTDDFTATLKSTFAAYDAHPHLGADGRIVHVPPHRILAASTLRLGTLIGLAWLLFGCGALIVGLATGNAGAGWGIAVTALFTTVTYLHSTLQSALQQANFSATLTGDGLLITQGVTSTERRLIPLNRIQAVGIEQPILWRPFGWWRAHFNIAASGRAEGTRVTHMLLPVGNLDDALAMLALALPLCPDGSPDTELTGEILRNSAAARPVGLHSQPRSSRWLDPLAWSRNGWIRTSSLTLIRHGRIKRRIELIPLARVQSLALHQGPVQRRLGLASLSLHSTKGPIGGTIPHQDADAAEQLFYELAEVTGKARHAEQAPTS